MKRPIHAARSPPLATAFHPPVPLTCGMPFPIIWTIVTSSRNELTTEHPLGNPWCGVETAGVGRKRWFLDLLGRARSLFKGLGTPSVAKVQYYSVVCPLGHRLRGQRTGGYQALRCPSCGEGIFVLPASPLPEPVASERSARARTAIAARADVDEGPIKLKDPAQGTVNVVEPDDLAVEAEIIWDDEVAGEASPAGWQCSG